MENDEIYTDVVVLYHGHCQDGFGSAYAAWKKFGELATYIACTDRVIPPIGLAGKEVYLLDYSYPLEVMVNLQNICKSFVVIDHHISAKEGVEQLHGSVFDTSHSGAYLSWQYFVGSPVPYFILVLEAMDMYKDKDGVLRNLFTFILSRPFLFGEYEAMCLQFADKEELTRVEEIGHYQNSTLERIVEMVVSEPDMIYFAGHDVPAVNMALPINEKSMAMSRLYEVGYPFSVSYRIDGGKIKVSLRGNGDVDLTKIAGIYGGGGHRGASGFVVDYEEGAFLKLWKWLPKSE